MKPFVFLDHLIQRDGLLYERSESKAGEPGEYRRTLLIRDLENSTQRALLRKPDFQRATYAWSPKECVDLLQAVLTEQVVPSVILWLDSEGSQYVLDGSHRISVLLAWISDDWGDSQAVRKLGDEALETVAKVSADEVRALMSERRIGSFEEHRQAIKEYERLVAEGKSPPDHLSDDTLRMANGYRRWQSVEAGFPILWVRGDYQKAEESFLAINKSGQRLSEWETALVENRTGAFARIVMSIAYPDRAHHCWPTEGVSNSEMPLRDSIIGKIDGIRQRLFEFPYTQPVGGHNVPLLGNPASLPDSGPTYVAEILTVVEGRRGLPSDTKQLLTGGTSARTASELIRSAETLCNDALQAIDNIYGPSPRSLSVMPLLYFYNADGMCIRSLLYGFLHWMIYGTDTDIANRKFVFTKHRRLFERVIQREKKAIVTRFSRRIGSGGEVTLHLGKYFDGLLRLLIRHGDNVESEDFDEAHNKVIEDCSAKRGRESIESKTAVQPPKARMFKGSAKRAVYIETILKSLPACEICGGLIYPGRNTQIDHKERFRDGGITTPDNGRVVHPFCNNNRDKIELLLENRLSIDLPNYVTHKSPEKGPQLNFFDILDFDTPAPWAELFDSDFGDEP